MKSSSADLESRGYVDPQSLIIPHSPDISKIILSLRSQQATERTGAALILEKILPHTKERTKQIINALISALKKEKKLYPKIAISNTLSASGEEAFPILIPLLASIGKNQHKQLPSQPFNKKSYPLPRDIVAIILIRFAVSILGFLEEEIGSLSGQQLREAIDVIGHISFNTGDQSALPLLKKLYLGTEDPVLKWKILRAFSAFNDKEVIQILKKTLDDKEEEAFVWEAERSLKLSGRLV